MMEPGEASTNSLSSPPEDVDKITTVAAASAAAPDLYKCEKCQEMLGRHRFPKKIFRQLILGDNGQGKKQNKSATMKKLILLCHSCKRLETANRCKQEPPKILQHDSTIAESGTKRRPNNFGYCDYVDKLFKMDCFATHIAPLKVFTSAKDVSESMAAIQAVMKHGQITPRNPQNPGNILCLCIGDGCTPRTALLMAFLAKKSEGWECFSIDPVLSEDWAMGGDCFDGASTKGVQGLHCYKGTLKEFLGDPDQLLHSKSDNQWRHLVLVCVHSHARFIDEASIENIRALYSTTTSTTANSERCLRLLPTTIVSLPCCPTFKHVRDIGEPPTLKYDDDCVFSACRRVEVWNLQEEEHQVFPSYCVAITNDEY